MAKKDTLKEIADKIWPKTKKELEKIAENTKNMILKGEEHIKELSEKGIEQTKKISLKLKKERLYYNLGKMTATTPAAKWKNTKRIGVLIKEIKEIEKQLKIKKR